MKKQRNYLGSIGSIAAIGLFSLTIILAPPLTTAANAQGVTRAVLEERNFRRDGDDPDRFVIKDQVRDAQDDDVIHLKIESVPELRNKVEIVLVASSNVRWWKGITIFKGVTAPQGRFGVRYVRFKHIDTQDDDKSESSGVIDVSDLGGWSRLVFEKAKAFGVHTEMYRFDLVDIKTNKFKYAGMRLTFTWERDG